MPLAPINYFNSDHDGVLGVSSHHENCTRNSVSCREVVAHILYFLAIALKKSN